MVNLRSLIEAITAYQESILTGNATTFSRAMDKLSEDEYIAVMDFLEKAVDSKLRVGAEELHSN